jgi:hypothetical protein
MIRSAPDRRRRAGRRRTAPNATCSSDWQSTFKVLAAELETEIAKRSKPVDAFLGCKTQEPFTKEDK